MACSTFFSNILLLVLVLCKHSKGSSACWAEEKVALLTIKASFCGTDTISCGGPRGSRVSDWDGGVDCCRWEGVRCDSINGRVTHLALDNIWFYDPSNSSLLASMLLNSSLFLPFHELQNLDLSSNYIQACVPNSGFEMWSSLRKLEVLNLSWNELNESIVESLARVSSLKTLLLRGNYINTNVLAIKDFSELNLEILDLGWNGLFGTFHVMGNWPFLKILSLDENKFNGTLSEELCKMINLQELDVSENGFTGILPSCLENLTSLNTLDLHQNNFQIKFPNSMFRNMKSLKYLSLSENQLEGFHVLSTFSNHSKLKVLELSSQNNKFRVETESPMFDPSFQLEYLKLSNCNLNHNDNIGVIPSFLLNQQKISYLDLSHNKLGGSFPSWLIGNNTNLRSLNLRNNSLDGLFVFPSQIYSNLSRLDVSQNKLSGKLSKDFGIKTPNLKDLNLSKNYFEGPLPWAFSEFITTLDISYNTISDHIKNVFQGNLSYLESLYISNNRFYGSLPSLEKVGSVFNMAMDNNFITGKIPNNICNLRLEYIDMSNNKLNGTIPNCLGQNDMLLNLNLSNNLLEGSIQIVICNLKNIKFLDLSQNNFSGQIPSCDMLYSTLFLHLSHNSFSGTFPIPLSNSPHLETIDIRFNKFSGTIPNRLNESFPMLRILLLEGNQFEGTIPAQICHLKYLGILDLSHNSLSGYIPSCLSNMGPPGVIFESFVSRDITFFPLSGSPIIHDYDTFEEDTVDREEFVTKSRLNNYQGDILNYFSGIDLSSNLLEGYIPQEIGNMNWARALNLSNNRLAGFIPKSLSNLTSLESLDLSHNYLIGQIPVEFAKLHFLESFSVAYNNLCGPILEGGQFNTFSASSFEVNPNLCGRPLVTICGTTSPDLSNGVRIGDTNNDDRLNLVILVGSFVVSFVLGFWGVIVAIYYKRTWNRALFLVVDKYTDLLFVKIVLLMRRLRTA